MPVAIKAEFLGETGKTQVSYYFDPYKNKRYLVKLSDYYTTPISLSNSKLASLSTNQFIVCEGRKPNYPNSLEMENVYNRAVDTLYTIRQSLQIYFFDTDPHLLHQAGILVMEKV